MASIFNDILSGIGNFIPSGEDVGRATLALGTMGISEFDRAEKERKLAEQQMKQSMLSQILGNQNLSQQQKLEALSQASPEFMQKRLELMLQPPKPLNAPNVMLDAEGNPMMTQYDPNDGSLYINGQKVGGGQGRQVPIVPSYGATSGDGMQQQPVMPNMPQGQQQGGVKFPQAPAGLSPKARNEFNTEAAKMLAKQSLESQANLPKAIDNATMALNQIEELRNHPGLSDVVGAKNLISGAITSYIPFASVDEFGEKIPLGGTNAADFMTRLKQLKGGAFLQAYETLKGAQGITNIEGQKAEAAIARMSTVQTEKEFKKALTDYESVIKAGLARAQKSAGVSPSNNAISYEEYFK